MKLTKIKEIPFVTRTQRMNKAQELLGQKMAKLEAEIKEKGKKYGDSLIIPEEISDQLVKAKRQAAEFALRRDVTSQKYAPEIKALTQRQVRLTYLNLALGVKKQRVWGSQDVLSGVKAKLDLVEGLTPIQKAHLEEQKEFLEADSTSFARQGKEFFLRQKETMRRFFGQELTIDKGEV